MERSAVDTASEFSIARLRIGERLLGEQQLKGVEFLIAASDLLERSLDERATARLAVAQCAGEFEDLRCRRGGLLSRRGPRSRRW